MNDLLVTCGRSSGQIISYAVNAFMIHQYYLVSGQLMKMDHCSFNVDRKQGGYLQYSSVEARVTGCDKREVNQIRKQLHLQEHEVLIAQTKTNEKCNFVIKLVFILFH